VLEALEEDVDDMLRYDDMLMYVHMLRYDDMLRYDMLRYASHAEV
jgi:hypothetical protein